MAISVVQGALFTMMVVRSAMLRDAAFEHELAQQIERSPRFFRNAPVVLDLKGEAGFTAVAEFAASGRLVTTIGRNLDHPAGVATDAAGHVWVTDAGHDRVVEFSSAGGVLASFGSLTYLLYALVVALVKNKLAEGWLTTSVVISSMFFCLFIILAVLAEYVARILEESQQRPLYFIELEAESSAAPARDQGEFNVVEETG